MAMCLPNFFPFIFYFSLQAAYLLPHPHSRSPGGKGEATMMDSLLSILPKGLFGRNLALPMVPDDSSFASSLMIIDENERKRPRDRDVSDCGDGSRTPTLISTPRSADSDEEEARPIKRFRGERRVVPVAPAARKKTPPTPKSPLSTLPEDVMAHCLLFLGSVEDRFSLQTTSKQFHRISSSDSMMANIQVGGDRETGMHGIIQEQDTPDTSSEKLDPFARAGNLEAMYMLGIIKSYCHKDVDGGLDMLKFSSKKGYVRSSYALGLILRDSTPEEAMKYMKGAAATGYIPALQEVLSAREMKSKHGEPDADKLRLYLDPMCLNRLLGRHYVQAADLRDLSTSHCWNPLCGRWALKANSSSSTSRRGRRSWGFSFNRHASHSVVSDQTGSTDAPLHEVSPTASNCDQNCRTAEQDVRMSRMKMCSRCCRAKYCSKLCQVYDWRSGRHKMECQFL